MPMPRAADVVHLLDVDPDLGALLSDPRRGQAQRELVVRIHRVAVGSWDVSRRADAAAGDLGLLIVDGVVSRQLMVADQVSSELLGAGDLVRLWPSTGRTTLVPARAGWYVLSSSTVAVLDRRFTAEAAGYPELMATLFDRLSERSLRLATSQAISQLTCVDRRLMALFWHLAERWGRVSGDGVIVPLRLTHALLGQLVGARRPTVSTALSKLIERGELLRRPDGSWLLRGHPPEADGLASRATPSTHDAARAGQRARELSDPGPRRPMPAIARPAYTAGAGRAA